MLRYLAIILLISSTVNANNYHVFGIGFFDFELDEDLQGNNLANDYRYELRLDDVIYKIGPEQDNFFYLKPTFGIEYTSDSASYLSAGIYLEDNLGKLFTGSKNKYNFTPSFNIGYFDEGQGKRLGSCIQFRTTFEVSRTLKNENRIGISLGHISNANTGERNPGAEIITLSYQIPF